MKPRFWIAASLVFAAALFRLLPHPWNFTPVGAIALFAGATFRSRFGALLVPLMAMLLSDAVIGFHSGMPVVYGTLALSAGIGMMIGRRSPLRIGAAAISSATLFYLTTNLWVWSAGRLYSHTIAGLVACYLAAIPFYGNDLAAHLLYSALLFGSFAWAERRFAIFDERWQPAR